MTPLFIAKRFRIKDLPNCYVKERLLDICINGDVEVNVVAKPGFVGDFSVYVGFPEKISDLKPEDQADYGYGVENVSSVQGVLSNGDKLSEQIALTLFPEFGALFYRH